jgi:hypothetical protein
VWKKAGWRSVSVAAYWRKGCPEPLLLSSLGPSASLVRQYRLRSAIEAMFRDDKSYGWEWEASQIVGIAGAPAGITHHLDAVAARLSREREAVRGVERVE